MEKRANRFNQCQHVQITLTHPNGLFRIDIDIVDNKRGELPDWNIIRESARILKRYTDECDNLTTCIVNYNGLFAGEVIYRVRQHKFIWYSRNAMNGKEVFNV